MLNYTKQLNWLLYLYKQELITVQEYIKIKEKLNQKYSALKE